MMKVYNNDKKIIKLKIKDAMMGIYKGLYRPVSKDELSKVEEFIPLYNPYHNNVLLIHKTKVANYVIKYNYRFPSNDLVKSNFLDNYNLEILYKTYLKVFYENYDVTQNMTICKRNSFLPQLYHLKPFFTRQEIISLGKDYKMNTKDFKKLCLLVRKNEMTHEILMEHYNAIIKQDKVGLIQFYTLKGSSMFNLYLRDLSDYNYKNKLIENMIIPVWELILDAPKFDNNYILYRFIKNDDFIRDININEIFTEKGFMSCTRDLFLKQKKYKKNDIEIKIKIPKAVKGVCLCIETISHFPDEQEVIFPPNSEFRMIKKENKKYEIEWLKNNKIKFDRKGDYDQKEDVNFLKIKKPSINNLTTAIEFFIEKYINSIDQFTINIEDQKILCIGQLINTNGIYKNFYSINSDNDFCIFSFYDGYPLLIIEIGEINKVKLLRVNYYNKYNSLKVHKILHDDRFLRLISEIAYYFEIENTVIFSEYKSCKITNNIEFYGGSYNRDLYKYMKNKTKRFNDTLEIELRTGFQYDDIDMLKSIEVKKIISEEDDDEVMQLYENEYKENDNVIDFILWIIKKYCYLYEIVIAKIDRVMKKNPFLKDYYILDPSIYLYNRDIIISYPAYVVNDILVERNIIRKLKIKN